MYVNEHLNNKTLYTKTLPGLYIPTHICKYVILFHLSKPYEMVTTAEKEHLGIARQIIYTYNASLLRLKLRSPWDQIYFVYHKK